MFRTGIFAAALIVSVPAMAADLHVETFMESEALALSYDWTGFYVGVLGGYAAASSTAAGRDANTGVVFVNGGFGPTENTFNQTGWLVGAQAGYLHQMDNFVLGAEGDVALANLNAPFAPFTSGFPADDYRVTISGLASARLKAGVAIDDLLLFVTAGLAGGNVHTQYRSPAGGADAFNYGGWQLGWTAGAGASLAVTDNVVLTGEYRYTDLGRSTGNALIVMPVPNAVATTDTTLHTATVGINFKF